MTINNAWVNDAVCAGVDFELFHEIKHAPIAIGICKMCPVRLECIDDEVETLLHTYDHHAWSVRGGLTQHELQKLVNKKLKMNGIRHATTIRTTKSVRMPNAVEKVQCEGKRCRRMYYTEINEAGERVQHFCTRCRQRQLASA